MLIFVFRMSIPFVSAYLDRTSMYMVVLQALFGIYVIALVASIGGLIGFTPRELIVAPSVIIATALLVSWLCAVVTKVPAQHISSLITALILALLILPSTIPYDVFAAAVITALAIASKYVFVWRKQHVANPVAVGTVLGSLFGFGGAAWWVASPVLFLPIAILGLLVVAKVRRGLMVTAFLATAFLGYMLAQWNTGGDSTALIATFFFSYPFVFLACFMLTEPFTMPSTKRQQVWYGVAVGVLASIPTLGFVMMTPELALLLANVIFFTFSLRQKLFLKLLSVRELAPKIFEFTFEKPVGMQFVAGQYLEWMLPHAGADGRGIRRYFTIASAPEDSVVTLALKVPTPGSTFKQALAALPVGGVVVGSQRAGDFVLPTDETVKLGWIAGGIGVTPFVSHARHLKATLETRDIVLYYATVTAADAVYLDVLTDEATVVPVVSSGEVPAGGVSGYVTKEAIATHTPDYRERTWYVSGPPPMVDAATKALKQLGVPRSQIVEDFFPGLA